MKKSIYITIGTFILVIVLVNKFLGTPTFKKLTDKAQFEEKSNQPELAEQTLLQILLKDTFNIEKHYQYIHMHFNIPAKKKVGKYTENHRDDKPIQIFYNALAESSDSSLVDLGNYGRGLIAVNFENYNWALTEFRKVKNTDLKYLNNSIGNVYIQLDSTKQAEIYFRKEIENRGNVEGAYVNLFELLFDQGKTKEINQLLKNKEALKYIPSRVEQSIYFNNFQLVDYSKHIIKKVFSDFNIWGFLAAFLIMGSWIMYLRKIDIFDVEKWRNIIFAVSLGMFFCFLTFPLTDFNKLVLGFKLNGNLINDFFYCVFGIGAIEEFVKIIPLLIILRFSKIINEPFDYILYASLSALGFAFIENIIYFSEHNLQIIHGRALTAVVSHMFDSSIIAYGLILNKYKRHRNQYLNFIVFFLLASLAHGFYDFWLINKSASTFSSLTFIFLLASMFMWNSFKNNALNQSAFYDKDISINGEKIQDYLLYSLAGVLLFEYVALAFKFSPSVANDGLFSSISSGTYLLIFLVGNLSKFTLNKGEWAPINYWGKEEKVNYDQIVGTEVKLNRFTNNDYTIDYLSNSGKIVKRVTVSKEPDWYFVKLDNAIQINAFYGDTVLIRTKEKEQQIEVGKKLFIAFYIIPLEVNLENENFQRTEFKFCGWAKVE